MSADAKLDTKEGRAGLLAIAMTAAREASKIVHAGWRKHPAVEHKGAVDLVTSFDRASELFLRERLGNETGFAVVGEEEGGREAEGAHAPTWYVDPLDGTTNFVHGHPFFCVAIGLFAGKVPVLGAVVAPALVMDWGGIAEERFVRRNGEACGVSRASRFAESLLATGFPYDRNTNTDNNFDAFFAIKSRCQAVRRCGSAAIDLCFVADGTYDGYWERRLKSWDLAAGVAIVQAAGGRVSDFEGRLPDIAVGNILATNGAIHDTLIAVLADTSAAKKSGAD